MLYYTLKRLGDTEKMLSWKGKGLSSEELTSPTTTYNCLSTSIKWFGNSNFCLVFKGRCLKQNNATYTTPKKITFFIVYGLDT